MRSIVLWLTLFVLFLSGCSQKDVIVVQAEPQILVEAKPQEDLELPIRKAIVETALKHLNKKNGHDCSGFVDLVNSETNEVFYKSNKLYKYFDNTRRSKAIFNIMKDENKLVPDNLPKIGDIVFFSDTLQTTKRKADSFNITHIGIVTEVDEDGTVHFIHNIQGKNRVDQLNTNFSDHQILSGKNVNSFLKRCPKNKSKSECLSSFFFSAYGSAIPNKDLELSKN